MKKIEKTSMALLLLVIFGCANAHEEEYERYEHIKRLICSEEHEKVLIKMEELEEKFFKNETAKSIKESKSMKTLRYWC